jgi:cobalt-zinc-cadmium efflux system membrane fusion protein
MSNFQRFLLPIPPAIGSIYSTLLGLLLVATPVVVLAHGGHEDEFQGENQTTETTSFVQVDLETAKRLGIKVEPVKRQHLATTIKTTGQIETLPGQKVEVTTPIAGAKVVELLVEPGSSVKKDQPLAVLTSPDLVTLRVESQEKLAQAQADLQQAQADLRLAQQNYDRYQQIAAAEIAQVQSQVDFARQKYYKDKQLANAGALPRRNVLESQTQLAEAIAELTKAKSRRDVIAAENQLRRAQVALEAAKKRISLSNSIYRKRLQQLGNSANTQGLVTVTAPISGKIATREASIGQTFNDAGGKLMTIVNDSRVFATANIYEKDLDRVKIGQKITLKVASIPERSFSGRISRVGTTVEGETRVLPVQAETNNTGGMLKPGMFAELEIFTQQASKEVLAIPVSAVVDVNGKKLVYVQTGNAYQKVEVTLGQTSKNMVEVKTGLFEGDLIVTQRAPQLYAQSLRGSSKLTQQTKQTPEVNNSRKSVPLWLLGGGGAAIATVAFISGVFWSSQRHKLQLTPQPEFTCAPEDSPHDSTNTDDNHPTPKESKAIIKQ